MNSKVWNFLRSHECRDNYSSPAAYPPGGSFFDLYFENLSEGAAIRLVLLTCHRVIIFSAAFLFFRTESHSASVDTKVCFFSMCLSKKHILFISCSSVISAASPHSIMSSQEAESPTTGWFEIISTQFHLFIQTAHAVKNIHLHPVGGFVCLFVCGVFGRHLTNCNLFLCALPFQIICCESWTGRPQQQLLLIYMICVAHTPPPQTQTPSRRSATFQVPVWRMRTGNLGWDCCRIAPCTFSFWNRKEQINKSNVWLTWHYHWCT